MSKKYFLRQTTYYSLDIPADTIDNVIRMSVVAITQLISNITQYNNKIFMLPSNFTVLRFVHSIKRINANIGKLISWLTLIMALTVSTLVIARSLFDMNSIAVQEFVMYTHALVFLLCFSYTAYNDGHVRVDIFYRRFSKPQKAWVNALGHVLLLLPFALFILFISWDYVLQSWGWQSSANTWGAKEVSADPGGLPYVYLLKSLIPLTGIMLAIHALCDLMTQVLCLCFETTTEKSS